MGSKKDVDLAVDAAKKVRDRDSQSDINQLSVFFFQAFKTTWGLHCPGVVRGRLLYKLADLIEEHIDEFAALEALDVGMCQLFSC